MCWLSPSSIANEASWERFDSEAEFQASFDSDGIQLSVRLYAGAVQSGFISLVSSEEGRIIGCNLKFNEVADSLAAKKKQIAMKVNVAEKQVTFEDRRCVVSARVFYLKQQIK